MSSVALHHVHVARAGAELLHDVSLQAQDGQLLTLLGASGSGKSSVLRAVAGLEEVTSGRVLIGGRDVTRLPTRERDLAMVHQSAQLQPHLDVRDNLGFPLAIRRVDEDEVDRRVEAEARAFSIARFLRRRPRQLSAGERRAAATASTFVRVPSAILMDEPLAQIDVHGRRQALEQIQTVRSGYGATVLLATNDQSVAASVADAIVLLDAGRVRQVGAYLDLYDRPADTRVAQYVGSPPMNLLEGEVRERDGRTILRLAGRDLVASAPRLAAHHGERVVVGIRPEHLELTGARLGARGEVRHREFTGPSVHLHVELEIGGRAVSVVAPPGPSVGEVVGLHATRLHVFDASGLAVVHDPYVTGPR